MLIVCNDSDKLDERLVKQRGVELIAPHRNNRIKSATQDGRFLRWFNLAVSLSS
jgi:hypothetical protein